MTWLADANHSQRKNGTLEEVEHLCNAILLVRAFGTELFQESKANESGRGTKVAWEPLSAISGEALFQMVTLYLQCIVVQIADASVVEKV